MMLARLQKSEWIPPLAAGLLSLAGYLWTLAPGLTFIDAGELATVPVVLGIAHPTGYPLFTLIGWVFARLPIASEPISRLNVMAALLCAAGIVVFTRLVYFLLTRKEGTKRPGAHAASMGAGLLLAFSETYWSQATGIEVYSLHCLFLATVIWLFLLAGDRQTGEKHERLWWLFAYTLGLSFTNHMTTILLAPGFLYYYFARQGGGARSWKRVGLMAFPFLLGLSLYLYLPIRASQHPPMNWGNPTSLERFLWHLSGKQYHVWIFSSTQAAGKQLAYFLKTFPPEFAYVGGLLALIGLPALWRSDRRLFIFTALLFIGCIGYSINYDIHDIDSYFLLAYFTTALWAGFGLIRLADWSASWPGGRTWRYSLLVALAALPFSANFHQNCERNNYLVEDYTGNMLDSFPPDALVLSFQWDQWVSAAYYEQLVRHARTDLVIIDKELLRRSWYYTQLETNHPGLIRESRPEVDAFLKELYKFEHDLAYDPSIIEARYAAMIESFLEKSMSKRPLFVTNEIEPQYTARFQRVPRGLAMQLYPDTLFHPAPMPDFHFRPLDREGRLEDQTLRLYATALVNHGDYYLSRRSDRAEAAAAYERALKFLPGEPSILQRLSVLGNVGPH